MSKRSDRASWFKFFFNQKRSIDAADDASVGLALKAALQYFETGELPSGLPMASNMLFATFQEWVDEANEDYQRSVENGKKGGRPKTHPNPPLPSLTEDRGRREKKEAETEVEEEGVGEEDTSVSSDTEGDAFLRSQQAREKAMTDSTLNRLPS